MRKSKINETIQDKDKVEIETQVRRALGSEVRRVDFNPNTIEVCVRNSRNSKLNDDDVWNDLYNKIKPLGVNDIEWFQESVQKNESIPPINQRKRIEFEDDIVRVYDGNKEIYAGAEDYEPMQDEDWKWDNTNKYYKFDKYIKVCCESVQKNEAKVTRGKTYYGSNLPSEDKPISTSWLNTDGTYSSYVFKNIKGKLNDPETIKGLDGKTFKSRKAANNYALRKGYDVYQVGESKINEISDELANRFLDKRVKNVVKDYYDDDSYEKETRAVKALIRRKARQGKPLTNDEKTYMRGEGEKFESKINEGYLGLPDVQYISHGDWSDGEVKYNGFLYNVWDLEDGLEASYEDSESDLSYDDWVKENPDEVYAILDYLYPSEAYAVIDDKNQVIAIYGDEDSAIARAKELGAEVQEDGILDGPFVAKMKDGEWVMTNVYYDMTLDSLKDVEDKDWQKIVWESKINENDGWKTDIWKAAFKKGDKIIVNRKGVEKEYIYHSKDPGIYGEDMHSVVDMTQKPRMLTHIHTADIARYKNMDESMFNKYGEEVDPKEWENKEARGLNEAKSNEVNIFLTNLGKYNEGELVGEWVELPVDDFQPILDRIGINDEYEEWFITDYEAPFEINEYDNIEELNDIAREIQDFDSTQLEVLDTYKENGYDMRDAIDKVIENDYFYLEGNTEEDLAWSYIDAIGSFEDAVSKEDKQYYFDYEAYGRDLVLGGDYTYAEDVVDLNSFADRDTAEMIFGSYGEDKPSEEDIAKYKKWIEIYGDYTDEQEEELAKQGIEVFMTSIYIDEVAYDVETLEQVVDENYEVQSGYKDYEGNIVDVSTEKELAEYVVDELFGGVDQLGEEELERYFDYAWWGKTLAYDFYKTDNGWVQLD